MNYYHVIMYVIWEQCAAPLRTARLWYVCSLVALFWAGWMQNRLISVVVVLLSSVYSVRTLIKKNAIMCIVFCAGSFVTNFQYYKIGSI